MPGGMWDSDKYEIRAVIEKSGKPVKDSLLKYSGRMSIHSAKVEIREAGEYTLTIYAFDPSNGNTGVSKTLFTVK